MGALVGVGVTSLVAGVSGVAQVAWGDESGSVG